MARYKQLPMSNPFLLARGLMTMTFSGQRFASQIQRFEGFQGRTQGYYYEVFGHANSYGLGSSNTNGKQTIASGRSKNLVLDQLKQKSYLLEIIGLEPKGGRSKRLTLTQ